MAIKYDAEERAATREASAVGEGGIVGEDGANAGEDGVRSVAELLDFVASSGAGEPEWLAGLARRGRRSELAVDGEGGFEGNQRAAVLDEVGKGLDEVAGGLLADAEGDFDVGGMEFGKAPSADEGVGIDGGDDDAGDAGGDERVGAGAGAAAMAAGFEGNVGGRPRHRMAALGGIVQRCDLGVVAGVVEVCAFSEDVAVANQDAADLRVGRGEGDRCAGEGERAPHKELVLCVDLH